MPHEAHALAGCRLLIVEDEFAVLMLLEGMAESFGCQVVATASNLSNALLLATTGAFDAALLDINLAGQQVYPIAQVLKDRGISFVFSTGYGAIGLDSDWTNYIVLQKPYLDVDLEKALMTVVSRI